MIHVLLVGIRGRTSMYSWPSRMSESDASRLHLKAYGQKRNTWMCLISISKMSSYHVKKERNVGKNHKFSAFVQVFLCFFILTKQLYFY